MTIVSTFGAEHVHPTGVDLERRRPPVHTSATGAPMGLICRRQLPNDLSSGAAALAPGCEGDDEHAH